MDNIQKSVRYPQRIINGAEFREKITNEKTKVILNIIGYCMLLLGSLGMYIALFLGKITMGKINISEKNLKKISAFVLIVVWCLFLTADCIKLNSMDNYNE
jgi:hypothetical protein